MISRLMRYTEGSNSVGAHIQNSPPNGEPLKLNKQVDGLADLYIRISGRWNFRNHF